MLLDKGWPAVRVADALFLDTGTARAWRRTYEAEGLSSLAISDYSKRTGHLGFEQEAELRIHLTAHPMRTSDEIRVYVEQTYGQKYSRPGAIKLMARLGFIWKKPKLLPLQASPEAQEKFIADYENLCTELPNDEAIVFVDAVHPEHQSRQP
ncbi:MAG: winged helix-turn-helix domain-containing protein, partial [Robiginitomaculum sp.]